jgi:tetratricopeptide (TPR) repeat protein
MKVLDIIEKYLLYILVLLLPIFVLPIFPNSFDTPKIVLLAFGIGLALLVKAIKTIAKGQLEFTSGSFDIPVLLLMISYGVAAFLKTPNKMDAFFAPGNATLILGASLLYFLINSALAKDKKMLARFVFISGVVGSFIGLLAFSGLFSKIGALPSYIKDTAFSPFGGALPAAMYLGITLLLGIGIVLSEKDMMKKLFYGIAAGVVLLGLALNINNLLPNKATTPQLPTFNTSWVVAVEVLKASPLVGIGSGNYLTAFNSFRPLAYNNTNSWGVRFTTASDFLLSTMTEAGLLGFASLVVLLVVAGKMVQKEIMAARGKAIDFEELSYVITLGVLIIVMLALPQNIPFIVLAFVLLALNASHHTNTVNLTTFSQSTSGFTANRILSALAMTPIFVGIAALAYFGGRAVIAEVTFNNGLVALTKNDGKTTYDLVRSAITLNPYVDRYHATYAQINLALARTIATKTTVTEEDKTTIAQLVQQAIREGKATVTLNPQRAGNWELLAKTYQSIMPFAQGADAFALQTYNQAIVLDPINPNLRIAQGGIFYALGRFDEAIRVFELAVISKPNLANAHYNLAMAYKEKGNIESAITAMTNVVALVNKDSNDYQVAKTELENLEKRKASSTTPAAETLTPPVKAEAPIVKPPVELPADATPPTTTP